MTVTHAEASPLTDDAVRPFAELRRDDVDYAGGKGANLGELTSAGLPVPDGFVVGAPAYAAFCVQTGLRERLAELLDGVDVEDTAALQAASAAGTRAVRPDPDARAAGSARSAPPTSSWPDEDPPDAGRRALLRHGRGHRRHLLRGDERDVPEHPRRRRGDRRRAPLLALAVRRAHHLLPGRQRLRTGRHGHRRRRAAPGQLDARRRDVHRQPRHRRSATSSSSRAPSASARRSSRARSPPTATSWRRPRSRSAAARFTTRTS